MEIPELALNMLIFRYGPLQCLAEILVCVPVATLAMCFARLISCTSQHEFLGAEGNADVAVLLQVMALTQTQYCCILQQMYLILWSFVWSKTVYFI